MGWGLDLGRAFRVNAALYGDRIALCDKDRRFTYAQSQARIDRLAAALAGMGLVPGDRVGVLTENCIEIVEFYLAAAQSGLVAVPINFLLVGSEIEYILNHSQARALLVHSEFAPTIDAIRDALPGIDRSRYIAIGNPPPEGYRRYDDLLAADGDPPDFQVRGPEPWMLIYTSGTTGRPKGVVRSHDSYTSFYLINAVEFSFSGQDVVMNVMPLVHVNSTFYTLNVLYVGGRAYIHPARRFRARELLEVVDRERITFISLVPTHYQLILDVPPAERERYDLSSLRKLLCSSAPARKETKLGIMAVFPNVRLYEAYGSTEAGLVTILRPEEQLKKLGSIGREPIGTDRIKLLDPGGNPVPRGEVGEIFSRSAMLFDGYLNDPERTAAAFRDGWFSARDMGRQDEDGYFYLVDRKDNMIITGGEKAFPKEIEEVLLTHPKVLDGAVIGTPDAKWGEVVTAVVVPREGAEVSEQEIIDYCDGKMARFKRPKRVIFIAAEEMPRTVTGKILHRELRKRFGGDGMRG